MANKSNLWGDTLEIGGAAVVGSMSATTATVGTLSASNVAISGNQQVAGLSTFAANTMLATQISGSGAVSIPSSGFFSMPASGSGGVGTFTGSLPAASAYPGGEALIIDTLGVNPFLLTGSFALMTTSGSSVSSATGTHLHCSAGASVGLWSDNVRWLVCACNGTLTLSA